MADTVFFSWQLDTDSKTGRNFVERALERALGMLKSDAVVEPVIREGLTVDRDTKGVAGSPPIVDTIFKKIDSAAVFVADLTFVGARRDRRPTPNPNVLIEYGWALKQLGYHRIIAVMNTAYGDPKAEDLPFDLRHLRHPITYHCPEDADDATRASVRQSLAEVFRSALRDIFTDPAYVQSRTPDRPFVPREPAEGRGRFRKTGEAIGLLDGVGTDRAHEMHLWNEPVMWLRLHPRRTLNAPLPVLQLSQEVKPGGGNNRLPTFRAPIGDPMCVRGGDGYGTADYAAVPEETDRTMVCRVAYAFDTGEIWSIDARSIRDGKSNNYIPFNYREWAALLVKYSDFLEGLNIAGPYEWIAGIEDMTGRTLHIGQSGARSLPCARDFVEARGTHTPETDPVESLRPFIQQIYDACRLKWTYEPK